jgi:predicted transcriptional regulator
MSNSESPDGPPSFEDAFRGDDVEQHIYGTILQTREPTTASAIANVADCDPKTARKYLGWFSELGIVTRHDGHPATYERNDAYFEWRRINQLAADHSVDDLQQRVRELSSKIEAYEDTYGAPTPAAVDAVDAAESSDDRTIDDVYGDLGDWATARNERTRYERARQQRASAETEQVSG